MRVSSAAANWLPVTRPTKKVPSPSVWWTCNGRTGKAMPVTRKPTKTTPRMGTSTGPASDVRPAETSTALMRTTVDQRTTGSRRSLQREGDARVARPQRLLECAGIFDAPDPRVAVRGAERLVEDDERVLAVQHQIARTDPARPNGAGGQRSWQRGVLLIAVQLGHLERRG